MTPDSAHVLVVDDIEASRYVRASWLRRGGHRVTEAVTGGQALDLLAAQGFDIVVLDVDLPDMSGFDVAERIKGDPRTAAIPVVHVSAAFREAEDRITGLNRGADAYLTEPVDAGELMATVEAALRYYRARALAERLADRLAKLTSATLAINAATDFDALVAEAARAAATVLASPAAAVVPGDGGRWIARTVGDGEVLVARAPDFDDLPTGASTVADPPWDPGVPAAVVVARSTPKRPAVLLAVPPSAVTTDEDRNLLVQLAQATVLAAEALRAYAEEHQLALILQRSLLPRELPTVPALPMAARYVPASAHAEIGGDFYEVTRQGDRFLIAIGDVCGHSIGAAIIMGEVRHALRAYAVEEEDPAEILRKLDAMLSRYHPVKGLTTMCLMLVDPVDGSAVVANAGHIPPLVAHETGADYLDVRGPILGIGLPRPPATHVRIPPGALVLLTTDGLVEHSGADLDEGMDLLRDAVRPDADMEALCDDLVARFGANKKDDIALFAFRRPRA
ncbi:fused response regulator/phosphatase [Actinosynnema sp. NPDC047251]|uniref:Response regulator receiver modulated serine phosphatase n=1 Tax=Saccharothrix espanaensis (strain ATCC 51144 / DSM 44229 / JCM 9112 / NBRC 15066 / NRRL 15764) TaxID=1179773 RepID=K0K3Z6_SACES|nr:fused response regulator/phosphatase [Saccharothrix espanaensis]CCH33031.1 Response regulator receiver modulated serine phosphatase [Saccharothrix espanaensis DSM 44229]